MFMISWIKFKHINAKDQDKHGLYVKQIKGKHKTNICIKIRQKHLK